MLIGLYLYLFFCCHKSSFSLLPPNGWRYRRLGGRGFAAETVKTQSQEKG
jgi:hypothetical protein